MKYNFYFILKVNAAAIAAQADELQALKLWNREVIKHNMSLLSKKKQPKQVLLLTELVVIWFVERAMTFLHW